MNGMDEYSKDIVFGILTTIMGIICVIALLNSHSFGPLLSIAVLIFTPLFSLYVIIGPICTIVAIYRKIIHSRKQTNKSPWSAHEADIDNDMSTNKPNSLAFSSNRSSASNTIKDKTARNHTDNLSYSNKINSKTNLTPPSPSQKAMDDTQTIAINQIATKRPSNGHKNVFRSDASASSNHPHSSDVQFLQRRGVKYLYHFTCVENLSSILRNGILSVNQLKTKGIRYYYNDPERYDDNLNAISVSVSFPNNKLFYKFREVDWRSNHRWAVLEMPVTILDRLQYKCYAHNAARYDTPSCSIEDMFGASNDEYPEDVQAEIMIESAIPVSSIECIYVDYPYGPSADVRNIVDDSGLNIPVVKSHKFFTVRRDKDK